MLEKNYEFLWLTDFDATWSLDQPIIYCPKPDIENHIKCYYYSFYDLSQDVKFTLESHFTFFLTLRIQKACIEEF